MLAPREIPYEVTKKPWFGPTKRAREMLSKRREVVSPIRTLEAVCRIVPSAANGVQFVRFIDYRHRQKNNFHFTIAVLWTESDDKLRQALFEAAETIVKETGWYPLPAGERLNSVRALRRFKYVERWIRPVSFRIGHSLESIEQAVGPDQGCSIRVTTSDGALLLDSGLPGHLTSERTDKAVLLSHFHRDHIGGALDERNHHLQLIMSRETAGLLLGIGRISRLDLAARAVILETGERYWLNDDVSLSLYRVPHCPGATGCILSDGRVRLVYTSDIVFRSARHDFLEGFLKLVQGDDSIPTFVLLDGTMAQRRFGASHADSAAELLQHSGKYKDIVLLARDAEQLLYSYLDLFQRSRLASRYADRVAFVLSPKLRILFEILHASFMSRDVSDIDPFILSQYGKSMSAWGESRWLFWLDSCDVSELLDTELLRLWFISEDELAFTDEIELGYLVTIGSLRDLKSDLNMPLMELPIDSSPWTLHSDDKTLVEVVRVLEGKSTVVLFHNFPKRLRAFSKRNSLDCIALSASAISLR